MFGIGQKFRLQGDLRLRKSVIILHAAVITPYQLHYLVPLLCNVKIFVFLTDSPSPDSLSSTTTLARLCPTLRQVFIFVYHLSPSSSFPSGRCSEFSSSHCSRPLNSVNAPIFAFKARSVGARNPVRLFLC